MPKHNGTQLNCSRVNRGALTKDQFEDIRSLLYTESRSFKVTDWVPLPSISSWQRLVAQDFPQQRLPGTESPPPSCRCTACVDRPSCTESPAALCWHGDLRAETPATKARCRLATEALGEGRAGSTRTDRPALTSHQRLWLEVRPKKDGMRWAGCTRKN